MKLYIKNMVSIPCKMAVKAALEKLNIPFYEVEIGSVELVKSMNPTEREQFQNILSEYGLELVEDRKSILIENIKKIIIEMVYHHDEPLKINFSTYLSNKLNHNYTYMANLFSEVTNISIENYIIAHKIERVKELLMYDELTLTEISFKLKYSSVAHLSSQFKKATGLTPSAFKTIQQIKKQESF